MNTPYKEYKGDPSLWQSSYEVYSSSDGFHLYRCLSENEANKIRNSKDSWMLDGNRLYLYSRKNMEEIDQAVKSYWTASEKLRRKAGEIRS